VQQALEETALLAQRIYPATLEGGGMAALLRSAAVNADVAASVDVAEGLECPPEVGMTVYLCWLSMLTGESGERPVAIDLREGGQGLAFEIDGQAAYSDADLGPLRDRVEALGGRLTISAEPGGHIRVTGSLPLS
jgi:hypothetical protein